MPEPTKAAATVTAIPGLDTHTAASRRNGTPRSAMCESARLADEPKFQPPLIRPRFARLRSPISGRRIRALKRKKRLRLHRPVRKNLLPSPAQRLVERDEIERDIGRAGLEVPRRLEITPLGVLFCCLRSRGKGLGARITGASPKLSYIVERMNNARKPWEAIHD